MSICQQKEKMDELITARSYGYSFLKRAFYTEPTKEYIKLLLEGEYVKEFPFSCHDPLIQKGVEEIELYLRSNDVNNDEEHSKLHWDYTRMFIGPRELPAPPWESSYVNEDKLLFQETTLQVRMCYLKHKFIPQNYPYEADDHIALELDFMYRLCSKMIEALEKKEEDTFFQLTLDQKQFLENHLVKWIPIFAKHINDSAETAYYQGLSKVLQGFILLDYQIISQLSQEIF